MKNIKDAIEQLDNEIESLKENFIITAPLLINSEIDALDKIIDKSIMLGELYSRRDLSFESLIDSIHKQNVNAGWWTNIETGESLVSLSGEKPKRNIPEMLMLIVTEISEAMEGHRENLMDDKLPHRPMLEVELADAVIRICDMAGGLNLDLVGAINEKHQYNSQREDHKLENRLKANGKKY
ncbi:hypothetical protein [uncultured Acinetobacter sp.]|uniref:hypothetical protein n=1 Tax=uncultured Acinetobacter sp. TaxID=165433 RepID=UPI00374A65DC